MMNTKVNQLLAKAMSTDSDDEAMSCLRMARKQGKSFDDVSSKPNNLYNGRTGEYWYTVAKKYHGNFLDLEKMYDRKKLEADKCRRQRDDLEKSQILLKFFVVPILLFASVFAICVNVLT